MAALTPTNIRWNTAGKYREIIFDLASVADGDTVDVPSMTNVDHATATHTGADVIATDSIAVATITLGNRLTFQVGGVARPATVFARGA